MNHLSLDNADTPQLEKQPPLAISLPLFGQHLIEASAGTGKTWTLTGVVLRLLIEAGYSCEHIIASTFTRSAAAEMRERIRGRLQDMQKLLEQCQIALSFLSATLHPSNKGFGNSRQAGQELDDVNINANITTGVTDSHAQYEQFMAHFLIGIENQGLEAVFDDPINQYLIKWLAEHEFGLPRVNRQKPNITIGFKIALTRTVTALNGLDRLFVGTLDSLCQKWLQEFSADTGYQPNMQISNNVDNIVLAMIHDQLRAFRATVSEHEPEIFELMYATSQLPKAEVFLPAVTRALNFYSTPIDPFVPKVFDLSALNSLFIQIQQADNDTLQVYAEAAFRKQQGMGGKAKLNSRFPEGLTIHKQLSQQGILGLLQLSERQLAWLESVHDFVVTSAKDGLEKGKGFNKGFIKERETFAAIPLVTLYAQLYQEQQNLTQHIDDLNQYFHRFICQYVRQQLPVVLEAQQLTTFSLQLARLNAALASKEGEGLARYIRYHYPVALIDESQDINTEQALLIQRIYLPNSGTHSQQNSLSKEKVLEKNKTQIKQTTRQFLLLVGDPKQAIYGFRGGDVANYNQLKAQFPHPPQQLAENRRSSPAVITGLNHWFGAPTASKMLPRQTEADEPLPERDQAYFLGEDIYYRHIQASRDSSDLFIGGQIASNDVYRGGKRENNEQAIYLLTITHNQSIPTQASLNVEEDNLEPTMDFSEGVAAQILALMDKENPLGYLDKLDTQNAPRPLGLSDIGILADKNKQLDALEKTLQQRGIPTSRGGSQSVFAGEMAQDLIVLMHAMLYPYDTTRLRRLLLSHFFGLSVAQVTMLDKQDDTTNNAQAYTFDKQGNTGIDAIQILVTEAGKLWQKSGFLTAIQNFMNKQTLVNHKKLNFWQRLAQHKHDNRQSNGERLLIDLRQLLDIISQINQGTGRDMGEYQLLEWLEQQQQEQPKEEWSMQQRLPSEEAVKLMTIHNSKGLEFPIVFVVGLDKKINHRSQTYQLYLYTNEHRQGIQNRRLSPVPYRRIDSEKQANYYKEIETQALYEEKLRLAYVALTRCRDRLYIVVQTSKTNEKGVPLKHWLQGNGFELPSHLTEIIAQVDINSLSKYFNPKNHYQSPHTKTANNDYLHWYRKILYTQFIGWSNTSFTALSRHLQYDKQAVAVHQADYLFEDELDSNTAHITSSIMGDNDDYYKSEFYELDLIHAITNSQTQAVRFSFEKGTNAGTFLHKILENLPAMTKFQKNNAGDNLENNGQLSLQVVKQWSPVIDRAIQTYQIDNTYLSDYADMAMVDDGLISVQNGYQNGYDDNDVDDYIASAPPVPEISEIQVSPKHLELATWLYEIIHTPLIASGLALAQIDPKRKIMELSFEMSLYQQDNLLQKLTTLFGAVGVKLNLQGQTTNYWRYLRGEIDLIYQAGEQYFVVDYKSNYLGNEFASYDQATMTQTMDEHGYWLQAAIYQVVLHRYLSLRLPEYDIHRHLGVVEYVFLRGMSPDYPEQGRLVCSQLTPDFIMALDKILGKAGSRV